MQPFDPDDVDEFLAEWEVDLADKFSTDDTPGVGDGEYPPMVGTYTESWLPQDL